MFFLLVIIVSELAHEELLSSCVRTSNRVRPEMSAYGAARVALIAGVSSTMDAKGTEEANVGLERTEAFELSGVGSLDGS